MAERLIELKAEIASSDATAALQRQTVELDQTRVGRLSRMDALQAQAMSAAISERRHQSLRRIEAALARIDDGEFGFCVTCGDPIDVRRLDLDPATPQCARCAGDREDK